MEGEGAEERGGRGSRGWHVHIRRVRYHQGKFQRVESESKSSEGQRRRRGEAGADSSGQSRKSTNHEEVNRWRDVEHNDEQWMRRRQRRRGEAGAGSGQSRQPRWRDVERYEHNDEQWMRRRGHADLKDTAVPVIRQREWRWPEAKKEERQRWRRAEDESRHDAGLSRKKLCEEQSTGESLPFHLILEHILVRLSVRQLCQLRCICKAWNSVLAWDGLPARSFLQTEGEEYWFVMQSVRTRRSALMAFSSHGRDPPFWVPLASRKLLHYLGGLCCSLVAKSEDVPTHFLASAGGLMCAVVECQDKLHDDTAHLYDVIVFNCLTGCVKVLPPPLDPDHLLTSFISGRIHMAVDNKDPFRYYVMLTDGIPFDLMDGPIFEIFDSRTGSWTLGSKVHSVTMKSSGLKVPNGDFLDFRFVPPSDTVDVLAYHVAQDAWSTVQVPFIKHDIVHLSEFERPAFLKHEGRFLVGLMLVNDQHSRGFGVWELQFTSAQTATLVEVARTPDHLFQPEPEGQDPLVRRLGAEGCLFYMTSDRYSGESTPPLVYDLAQNSWYVLPLERESAFVLVHRPRLSMCLPGGWEE